MREGYLSNFVKPQISLNDSLGAKLPLFCLNLQRKPELLREIRGAFSLAGFRSARTAQCVLHCYQQAPPGLQLNRTLDRSFLFISSPFLNRLVVHLGNLVHVCKVL